MIKVTHLLRGLNSRSFSTSGAAKQKVAFVGLGNMGLHMANNLLKSGNFELSGFDVNPTALSELSKAGGQAAATPAEAAENASFVITMLPSNDHVKKVYKGPDGILSSKGWKQGCLCIDSSTIDPLVSREVNDEVTLAGGAFVDAPVSGGVGGAEAGTLTFMVGGTDANFEHSKTVLNEMGANIVHCGDVGTGEVAKLCNNMVLAISMLGVSEAMNLGEKLGMDPKVLAGIMNTSTARCWSSDTYNPTPGVIDGVPSSRNYEGGFGTALMLKDLGLATDAAKASAAPVPIGASAQAMYELMVANGLGSKDFSVAYQFLKGNKP
mmetsp:Transcript_17922/g.21785  ORF Transcript_17922/g.21785 Transcript_17922/m.21785 type:complete len:323 (-) Transcript_17922:454-1422(-)|eukprot:CAMPEP_0184023506 /NCGR_PEP_ID=MMETSP0954-20121128/11409_1 /TAXON_ID=627963 /ORGANISM="Aplanochytrium sp, Strain PBS07" /LENGTH=322 /DNA_ID=CAMNT_0026306419 /DNA_START=134 /DNA_END=1102 /DNA_ORIENTATION=-